MPTGAHCNHCDADQAVIPLPDYEKDRVIYSCVYCGWWGLNPLRMEFPPTDEVAKARRDVMNAKRKRRR